MFLALMLVGYAASKFKDNTDNRKDPSPWHQRLFGSQEAQGEPAPVAAEDPLLALGAEAWVSLPAETVSQ